LQKKRSEEEENKRFKFVPEIGFTSKLLAEKRRVETRADSNKPIFDQLLQEKKLKETKLRKLQNDDEEQHKHQFKPVINEISAWIAQQKNPDNVYQRLTTAKPEREFEKESEVE